MQIIFRFAAALALLSCSCLTVSAKEKAGSRGKNKSEQEAATRLQIFLDRANFGPGKLDGHYGEFTRHALALYRQSRGEQAAAPAEDAKAGGAPNVEGLDLASIEPVFITYTVTEADLQNVGELPDDVAAKAKLKALPYRDAAEAVAEKFHCDVDFLEKLNPGKTKTIMAGDQLQVPNVEPFDPAAVKELKPGSEIAPAAVANEIEDDAPAATNDDAPAARAAAAGPVSIRVDTATKMLVVLQGDKVVAAYPVSVGSERTPSPLGDWKVRGVAKMPTFRYDEKVLNEGERSDDFKMLPPGPNSPVGVIWIALNKKAIGIHGTDDPDSIGRGASHGCVRMANWDVVRLAGWVKSDVAVAIE